MAAVRSSKGRNTEQVPAKFKDREITPERRTRAWTTSNSISAGGGAEPKKAATTHHQKIVAVVYYLSRNGQLDHPHFMEVPLSSNHGLYLHDVINRLDFLRGKGMASLYSWSAKRSYKNGFVWHDLADDDFIHPANGHEYVLKGSELLETTTLSPKQPPEIQQSEFPVITRRRNQSWSSIDLNEYKVYKAESFSESTRKLAADASTQTDDRRRRRQVRREEEQEIEEMNEEKRRGTEGNGEEIIEISPPPSDSSPETLETLMKADGRLILSGNNEGMNQTVENCGRTKASSVLMQLISCGSISFRDCGATGGKEPVLSLIGQYKGRLPRGGGGNHVGTSRENSSFPRVKLEDKEYFSGSLIETKTKEKVPALKRSNSYDADRCSQLELAEKEIEGVRTKCIPRKSKATTNKKENNNNISVIVEDSSQVGSKSFEAQQVENEAK